MGYAVTLAADFVTDNGNVFDGNETAQELATSGWSAMVATNIAGAAEGADEIDLDLELLPASARENVTQLVTLVAAAVHPNKKLGVFLPPATMTPSDVPGGDAFDIATIAQSADRFRVLTVDYAGTAAGTTPGPTLDSGWAVDAVRFAVTYTSTVPVDVSFPLYGNDFTTSSQAIPARSATFLDAVGLAQTYAQTPQRAATQELVLEYTDDTLATHELWYSDATSAVTTLGAWDYTTLPSNIGVVFYGLGAEDPALWDAVSKATTP
jgi:spore germination protein YaaH